MPSEPRISAVVPTYNRADILGETLRSILAQTRPPHEVIVVDDGGTDDTPGLVAREFPSVRLLRTANGGDLAARNAGMAAATGELVAFCDSDDLWAPDHLACAAALFAAEPALRVAYANFRVVRDGVWDAARTKFDDAPPGWFDGLRRLSPDHGVFDTPPLRRVIAFQPFFQSCNVVDREFFLAIGGWDAAVGRVVGCDLPTTLRLAEHAPFGVVLRPTVGIRKHAANFSGDAARMNLGDADMLDHCLRTRPQLAPLADDIRASAARRRREAMEITFARGDLAEARRIAGLLPPEALTGRARLKAAVAALPAPLAAPLAGALLAIGSWRSGKVALPPSPPAP